MTTREKFYELRDRRTVEYGVSDIFDVSVTVVVGPRAAETLRGQILTLALVNMLARIHRRLFLDIPSAPLLRATIVDAVRLDDAAAALARAIDPFIILDGPGSYEHAVGVGDARSGLPWYVGAERQVALLDRLPLRVDAETSSSLGAGLAACLAASTLLRQTLGWTVRPARVSAWNVEEADAADPGPDLNFPLNVGDVLQIGAGGVGSCAAYWLREFGVEGRWRIVDPDLAELHNTNRCLGLLAADSGWPDRAPASKADVAAKMIGGESISRWYDECDLDSQRPDLVLPLANEKGVRRLVGLRGEPLLLHATTSRGWEAQLHRHVPDRDDCINCRMPPEREVPRLACSTAELPVSRGAGSSDAALPFLSAAAGLLLVSGLYRLQCGELLDDDRNLWALAFNDARRFTRRGRHTCESDCRERPSAEVRRRMHVGRRWASADLGARPPETRSQGVVERLMKPSPPNPAAADENSQTLYE